MNRVTVPRRPWRLGALAGAVALAGWLAAERERPAPPERHDGSLSAGQSGAGRSTFFAPFTGAPMPATAQPAPAVATPAQAGAAVAARVTVAAPRKLLVGEQNELSVDVGADAGEVSFTLRFDPDVLQARAGARGDWAAAGFAAEIPDDADRVRVRSVVVPRRPGAAASRVAVVEFQAVGPGTTTVLVTDFRFSDGAGRPLPFLLSSASLQVTAEPQPVPPPGTANSYGATVTPEAGGNQTGGD